VYRSSAKIAGGDFEKRESDGVITLAGDDTFTSVLQLIFIQGIMRNYASCCTSPLLLEPEAIGYSISDTVSNKAV
jgi:hypothetical protein